MTGIRVTHGIGDLANDMVGIANHAEPNLSRVVRSVAVEGNRIAKRYASRQHTMHSDIDVPYQRSFSAEARGPLSWEYGPVDDGIPHGGSQAVGYENGSVNQRPHNNLRRSQDVIGPRFGSDVTREVGRWFW